MAHLWRAHRRRLLLGLAWAAALSLATTLLSHGGYLDRLNLYWLDTLFSVSRPVPPGAVRVIRISDDDFARLGHRVPPAMVPRRTLALGLHKLEAMRPRLVALDLVLDTPSSERGADEALAAALGDIRSQGVPVVLAAQLDAAYSALVLPLRAFGGPADCGFVEVAVGEDWVVRSVPEALALPGGPVYSFAGRVIHKLRGLQAHGPGPAHAVGHGETVGHPVPINFAGAGAGATGLSFADLLEDRLPSELLEGKVVVVGRSDRVSQDFHLVPARSESSMRVRVPGVIVQAACIDTLGGYARLKHSSAGTDFGIETTAGLVVVLLLLALRPLWGTLSALVVVVVPAILLSVWLFDSHNYWLNIVPTVLGVIAHGLVEERRSELERRRLLEGLVSPRAASLLLRHGDDPLSTAAQREVVVVLVDIGGSTALVPRLGPERFRELMNSYYGHVTEVVWRHGGIVNQLMGDGVMCLFGALPDEPGDPVERALAAAQEVVWPSRRTARAWRAHTHADLPLRAAMAGGEAFVGSIGTRRRFHFTAVGDVVNAVFRMVDLPHPGTKPYVWVTEDLLPACGSGWQCACTHQIQLAGHDQPICVCEMDVPEGPRADAGGRPREGQG